MDLIFTLLIPIISFDYFILVISISYKYLQNYLNWFAYTNTTIIRSDKTITKQLFITMILTEQAYKFSNSLYKILLELELSLLE